MHLEINDDKLNTADTMSINLECDFRANGISFDSKKGGPSESDTALEKSRTERDASPKNEPFGDKVE